MELFPDTITEFSRVSWLMERRLSDKIFVTKLNVRSTEELFDPDMLTIKEAFILFNKIFYISTYIIYNTLMYI